MWLVESERAAELTWMLCRKTALHTSALFFGTDFVDNVLGRAMILHAWWEAHHNLFVSYSAFAATVIVYIDGHHERVKKLARKATTEVEKAAHELDKVANEVEEA